MISRLLIALFSLFCFPLLLLAEPPKPTLTPLMRTVDLKVGESQEVELDGGKKVTVKLVDLREVRDDLRNAVRKAARATASA